MVDSKNIKHVKNVIDSLQSPHLSVVDKGKERFDNLDMTLLNVYGNAYKNGDDESSISLLPPEISNITGEAIEKKVLYTAQYGTPLSEKDGWYWSATVDTNITGIYSYTMYITLYKKESDNTWTPVVMTHTAQIRVTNEPQINGFTNAGIGYLPIY